MRELVRTKMPTKSSKSSKPSKPKAKPVGKPKPKSTRSAVLEAAVRKETREILARQQAYKKKVAAKKKKTTGKKKVTGKQIVLRVQRPKSPVTVRIYKSEPLHADADSYSFAAVDDEDEDDAPATKFVALRVRPQKRDSLPVVVRGVLKY